MRACIQKAETNVVVAITGSVVVAIGNPHVVGVIVPATTSKNAVRACL
jgi:hypothetical protein